MAIFCLSLCLYGIGGFHAGKELECPTLYLGGVEEEEGEETAGQPHYLHSRAEQDWV